MPGKVDRAEFVRILNKSFCESGIETVSSEHPEIFRLQKDIVDLGILADRIWWNLKEAGVEVE
jgi:hypothetical protein